MRRWLHGGGCATGGVSAPACGFSWSTETHVREDPISNSSFFLSRTSMQYGPQYVASSSTTTPPSHRYTWDASWTSTSRFISASLAGVTMLGISTFAGEACGARGGSCSWLGDTKECPYVASAADTLPPPLVPHVGPTAPRGGAPANRLRCT